jgi:hypothetical protein
MDQFALSGDDAPTIWAGVLAPRRVIMLPCGFEARPSFQQFGLVLRDDRQCPNFGFKLVGRAH